MSAQMLSMVILPPYSLVCAERTLAPPMLLTGPTGGNHQPHQWPMLPTIWPMGPDSTGSATWADRACGQYQVV